MSENKAAIYIIDDEPIQRNMLKDHLAKMSKYDIHTFPSGEECIAALKVRSPKIVFLDYFLNSELRDIMNGVDTLKTIKKLSPETEVILISGQDKIEVAVNSMKYGAFDYIVKGEGAFYRAEKGIANIYRYHKLKRKASRYKRLSLFLGIGLLLFIVLIYLLLNK